MKSIRSKMLAVVISGILLVILAIGTVSVIYFRNILNEDSNAITTQVANTEADKINNLMTKMEYTVKIMENYVSYSLESTEALYDPAYVAAYLEEMKQVLLSTIGYDADEVVSYYFRLNPDIAGPTAGFFVAKHDASRFENIPVASLDDEESKNAAAWWSEPAKAGKSIWLMPSNSDNNHISVITYATPIYKNGLLCGVIGMEIDYVRITEMVSAISVYDNGFAYLVDADRTVIYSPVDQHQLDKSHTSHGFAEEHRNLVNGMQLVIHVDYADMQDDANSLFSALAVISVFILIIFILITVIITGRIVRPIKELADSADRIVDGKYEFDANSHMDEEVIALGTALQRTADKVAKYMNYINALAYRDALTGVKNSTAYNEMAVDIERSMRLGESLRYAILVADLNFLKRTNDMYGHEVGNQYIIKASKLICNVFKHSPVFRIGGDEFVVLLKNEDLENMDELVAKFDGYCESEVIRIGDYELPISIARGVAEYNPDFHTSFEDVFDCADREMYIHKNKIKQHIEGKIDNIPDVQ